MGDFFIGTLLILLNAVVEGFPNGVGKHDYYAAYDHYQREDDTHYCKEITQYHTAYV